MYIYLIVLNIMSSLKIKFSFFLSLLLIFFNTNLFAKTNKTEEFILDRANATKLLLTPPNIVKNKISDAFKKIENECCEENFSKNNLIDEIKVNLQECLDKKCHAFVLPIYSKNKPPLKLVVMRQLNKLDDLIIENGEQKYNNLMTKLSGEKDELKLKNEKDIEKVKKQVLDLEEKNIKLKQTVDKMLSKYQKKISKLEEENKKLNENFNLVFNAHSKTKQKKLEKELK